MHILLVEDDLLNIEILKGMIQILYDQIEITITLNGQEAIDFLKTNAPVDLILSDVQMPVMDGYRLVKAIKDELKLDIPVISITAHAFNEEKARLIQSGFDDYVSKPIDMHTLELVLDPYLKQR